MKICQFCQKEMTPSVRGSAYDSLRRFCSPRCSVRNTYKKHKEEFSLKDGIKKCYECKNSYPISGFYVNNKTPDKLNYICINCAKKKGEFIRLKTVHKVIGHYSRGKFICSCCGRDSSLGIDHIDGKGKEHRKQLSVHGLGQVTLYYWLINNNFPKGYQVLCHACNARKNIWKKCNCKELKKKYPQFAKIL